jgi:hypothetical protein
LWFLVLPGFTKPEFEELVLPGFTGRGATMGKRRLALEKGSRSG